MADRNILGLPLSAFLGGQEFIQAVQPTGAPNTYRDVKVPAAAFVNFNAGSGVQLPNTVYAGPTTGPNAAPTFRALVNADIPTLHTLTFDGAGSSVGSLHTLTLDGSGSSIAGLSSLGFTITGSVPSIGIYAPAANSLAFATNTLEAFRVDSSQRVLIGGTAPLTISNNGATPSVQLLGSNVSKASTLAAQFSADAVGPRYAIGKSRNAAVGSHTIVQLDDDLGGIVFQGSDGTQFQAAASIRAVVDGTPGAADMPGRLAFNTTPDGAAASVEAMRIDNVQRLIMGGSATLPTNFNAAPLNPRMQVAGIDSSTSTISAYRFSADTSGSSVWLNKSRNAAVGGHTIVQANDTVGNIIFGASTGTAFEACAQIVCSIDATPGASDMPGRLMFMTTPDGTIVPIEAMRIDNAQRVVVGGVAALTGYNELAGAVAQFQINGVGVGPSVISTTRFSADAGGSRVMLSKSRAGSAGTNTIVQSGDTLGRLVWAGANGTSYDTAAAIEGAIDGTPGASNDMPGRLVFYTTPDGTSSINEAMRIDNAQRMILGGVADTQNAKLTIAHGSATTIGLDLGKYSADAVGGYILITKSRNASLNSQTIVQNNDEIGAIIFRGTDGSGYVNVAYIQAQVDATPGASDMPGRLIFATTPDGSTTSAEALRIDNVQRSIWSYGATVTPATLSVNGQWTLTPTSNTNFRISYRGTDGTTRVGNITLA